MLKIIGGEFRSRRLAAPEDESISRPYAQRVKEAVFNMLREWFDGARVLDLFAGVGTMGLEAVSRGAERVVMVERSRPIYRLLKQNIDDLDCADRAESVLGDALGELPVARAPRPVDVMFVDPPYPMMEAEHSRKAILGQVERLRPVLADRSFVVLRSPRGPRDFDLEIPGYDGPEEHQYGKDMWVLLYAPSDAGAD